METIPNKRLSNLKIIKSSVDDLDDDLKSISEPLPKKSFGLYLVGKPSSGKSSLLMSLLMSKEAYLKKFDRVYLMSESLDTLPIEELGLEPGRIYSEYNEEKLKEIIKNEKDITDNNNVLVILDDVVRSIATKKGDYVLKMLLNRRHITHNKSNKQDKGGLSLIITSQSYNLLPLKFRKNMSNVVLFSSTNEKEIKNIKEELMSDLNKNDQNKILNQCWNQKYGFLFVNANAITAERYFDKFNQIVI
jgi:tRNA U34 5-carboxymethylaminomethyl modifying GTPase MnmE/TrmE